MILLIGKLTNYIKRLFLYSLNLSFKSFYSIFFRFIKSSKKFVIFSNAKFHTLYIFFTTNFLILNLLISLNNSKVSDLLIIEVSNKNIFELSFISKNTLNTF